MTSLVKRAAVLMVSTLVSTALVVATGAPAEAGKGRGDRGDRGPSCRNGYVALTFDDGPNAATRDILSTLRRERAQATFFSVGARAQAEPDTLRRIASSGYAIGNHSYDHAFLDTLTYEQTYNQLLGTNQIIASITGRAPTMFRPPYGRFSTEHAPIVPELGMYEVLWTLDTYDWMATAPHQIVASVSTARAGDIVLLHDQPLTAAALPYILDGLERRGLCTGRIAPSTTPTVAWEGRSFYARVVR